MAITSSYAALVLFTNAYEGLEHQFQTRPTHVLRRGADLALYFELDRFQLWHDIQCDDEGVSSWAHLDGPLYDEVESFAKVLDDQIDDAEYSLCDHAQNCAVFVLQDGSVVGDAGNAQLSERFQWASEAVQQYRVQKPNGPKGTDRKAVPKGASHVFVAAANMGRDEYEAWERDFPVHSAYYRDGVTLLHLTVTGKDWEVTKYWDDGDPREHQLVWPAFDERYTDLCIASDERSGYDSDNDPEPADRHVAMCQISDDGSVDGGNFGHPFFDLFHMKVERRVRVSIR
ncbi:hypothetical protein WG922_07745 [Ramlibacter sp. AN1015]|uniref:hypothetical protein n=1 Tax=Ramlibacter sp. AN1015 TaxID=3133428 RepID=UPI0030C1FE3C